MATLVVAKPIAETFAKAEVVAALQAELIGLVQAEAETRGISLPANPASLATTAVPIDSLSVVDILCVIEPIIKVELRESIVRTGGYNSVGEALEHLVPQIERAWVRKKEQKK